jgi:hypothetical protein
MSSKTATRALMSLLVSVSIGAGVSLAAVTPEQSQALGTTLTAVGAEQAGSSDGTIPAYTGGLAALDHGGKAGETGPVDPYAGERPLRVITAAEADGVSGELTAGTRELLLRRPGFRLEVYPTHRSAAFPEWFVANTKRNATSARSGDDGLELRDALPGVPFPIPANGSEVMWNHRLRYIGRAIEMRYQTWLEDAAGQSMLTTEGVARWEFPAFDAKHSDRPLKQDETLFEWRGDVTGPQRHAGEAMLVVEGVNPLVAPRRTWSYVPGQRRVRLINMPDDAPSSSTSGAYIVDDAFVFNGALDRFDLKLLGRREVIVPYNTYRMNYQSDATRLLRPGYLNPDVVRWELHRVWVVEATLRPGQRHPYSRRVFYVDEDTWIALASDGYDADGRLVRAVYGFPTFDLATGLPLACTFAAYSLQAGNYVIAYHPAAGDAVRRVAPWPDSAWSPDQLAGSGVR